MITWSCVFCWMLEKVIQTILSFNKWFNGDLPVDLFKVVG